MKITRLDLSAPIEIGDNRTQMNIRREIDATEEKVAEISILNGPITLRLEMSMEELRRLAWDIMQTGLRYAPEKTEAQRIIIKGFEV